MEVDKDVLNAIEHRLANIEDKLKNSNQQKEWLSIDDLIKYLPGHPSKSTIYLWVDLGKIPYSRIRGTRRLSFSKALIDDWLLKGNKQDVKKDTNFFKS